MFFYYFDSFVLRILIGLYSINTINRNDGNIYLRGNEEKEIVYFKNIYSHSNSSIIIADYIVTRVFVNPLFK